MEREFIILFSMGTSGCLVFLLNKLLEKIEKRKSEKIYERLEYIEEMEDRGKIQREFVNAEILRLEQNKNPKNKDILINGKRYNDSNTFYILSGTSVLLIGKKEDFIIEIINVLEESV